MGHRCEEFRATLRNDDGRGHRQAPLGPAMLTGKATSVCTLLCAEASLMKLLHTSSGDFNLQCKYRKGQQQLPASVMFILIEEFKHVFVCHIHSLFCTCLLANTQINKWSRKNISTRKHSGKKLNGGGQQRFFSKTYFMIWCNLGSVNWVVRLLWSTKYILPETVLRTSQPGGSGPSSSQFTLLRSLPKWKVREVYSTEFSEPQGTLSKHLCPHAAERESQGATYTKPQWGQASVPQMAATPHRSQWNFLSW